MYEKIEKLIEFATSDDVASISRRYFTMNGFDGAMTILGIVLGSLMSGITYGNLRVVIFSALGSTIALGLSGLTSAFVAERTERLRELKELEMKMQSKLGDTDIGLQMKFASMWTALINCIAPITTSIASLSPLLMVFMFPSLLSPEMAAFASILVDLVILFLLGVYLGKVSQRSLLVNGIKMVVAGIAMTGVLLVVRG